MVEPINLQILVTTVDEVAKIKNVQEHSIVGQQLNAGRDEAKEIERKNTTVIESKDIEKKGINREEQEKKNNDKRYLLRERKKRTESEENTAKERPKEPNKGGMLDIEI